MSAQAREKPLVAVIGAGAAGISAAHRLRKAGADVRVYEASEHVGGRSRSVQQGDFRFDIGAAALPSTYTNLLDLVKDLGISDEIEKRHAVVGVLSGGQIHRIERKNPLTFLTAKHLSAKDKLSLWRFGKDLAKMFRSINFYDMSTMAEYDTETIADYTTRHYPSGIRDTFLHAAPRALLVQEPEQSSVVDLFSGLKALLVGSYIVSHPEGVDFYLTRAAKQFDVTHRARVLEVTETEDGVTIRWQDGSGEHLDTADAAVIACTGKQILGIYPGLDATRRAYLENLEYSSCIVVQLGVRNMPAEKASMVLIPRDVEPDLPVVGLGHNLGPNRAPAGDGALTAFWMSDWSRAHMDDSEEDLVALTVDTINRHLPGWADSVETTLVTRWQEALVASRPGTYAGLVDFQAANDPNARVQLAGDYLAQASVNASIASGERTAERLKAVLSL